MDEIEAAATSDQEIGVEDGNAGAATHFLFEHKIFHIPGMRFSLAGQEREPVLLMSVGEHEAALSFGAVIKEFNLDPDGHDGKLLIQVGSGLKFVKDIRHGDTIPREILDGSASWSINEAHHARSKNKLQARIALSGRPPNESFTMPDDLGVFLDLPATKLWLQSGLDLVGEKIGMGAGRAPSVAEIVDKVARELAYIEALRDRYEKVSEIDRKLERVAIAYKTDRQFVDEVKRARFLIKPPIENFQETFSDVDILTRQYENLIKMADSQIEFIRNFRDILHEKMLIWDELIAKWDFDLASDSKQSRQVVQFTYRFLATNFPRAQDW